MTEENRHNRLTGLAVGLLHWLMHRGTTVAAACAERPMRTFALVALFFSAEHFVLGPFSYLDWHDLGNGITGITPFTASFPKRRRHTAFTTGNHSPAPAST